MDAVKKAALKMSYYDVDAILTDSQKLPCTFELDVPGLGYLDGNAGGTVSLCERSLYCIIEAYLQGPVDQSRDQD